MSKVKYVLVEKIVEKITDESITTELAISTNAMDILEELKRNLDIHVSWGEIVSMTDSKTFMSETCDRVYLYSIEVKKDPVVVRW